MFAMLGSLIRVLLLPGSVRDIDLENLALRHQLMVFKAALSPSSHGRVDPSPEEVQLVDFGRVANLGHDEPS